MPASSHQPAAPPSCAAHDDDELVERVLAGDPRAARAVLARVGPAILRTVRGVLGGGDPDVDDLVQEAMVALLRALPAFRGDGRLTSFATGIAAKLSMSALRRRYRRRVPMPDDLPDLAGPVDLEAAMQAEQRLVMVRTALTQLPRVQAETLLLRWILGHSLGDVAKITGAPVNTVRSRLRLGRNTLSSILAQHPMWRELEREAR
ncbi:MAG: sigma-70 family RNA polymerase sigma factor [Myxococcota bacterium]